MRISAVTLQLRRLLLGTTALTGLALAAHPAAAAGLPTGGVVTVGTASIAQTTANNLAVTTGGPRTVIDWQSFSITGGNKVTIQQPGKSSITVNEVTGGTPSQIFGSLSSNGQVVLANPNGIWFGPDSHVDVAGLVASTATMTDQSKKAFGAGGRLALDNAGSATASIVNDGHITIASAGLGALVAPGVRNNGVIQATLGTVTLAAGTTSTLDFYGDGLVSLAVTTPVTALAIGPDGKPFKAAIENNGTLSANGGHVLVTADVVKGVVDNVINMSGVTEAKGVTVAGGDIVLDGGDGGVMVAGALDASATKAGQAGGSIAVTGGAVTLASTAALDASGATGGGKVQVGGGPHGGGTVKHAQSTTVLAGAAIKADATQNGTGGTVSVWSDVATRFDGSISAKGAGTGNGGWVETSSKGSLQVDEMARVDTSAPGGMLGSWLLDPTDITVVATVTGPNEVSATSIGSSATDPNLSATHNITVSSEIDMSQASLTMTAGNILAINAPINLNAGGTNLTLIGQNSVNISANLFTSSGFIAVETALGGEIQQAQGTQITANGPLSMFVDGANPFSQPATSGATIAIGGTIQADGIYIKAGDQQFNEAGFIELLGTASLTNTGASTQSSDANHADLILFSGFGGTLQVDSGAQIVANAGNIALLADTLTLADSPVHIATPGSVIVSPASTLGKLIASNPNYNDFSSGSYDNTQTILTGVSIPVTESNIGVGTGAPGTFQVSQSTINALDGTSTTGTVGGLQIGLPGPASGRAGLNIAGPVNLPLSTALYGGNIDFTGTITGSGDLTVAAGTSSLIDLGATITTSGTQTYSGPITLTSASTLTTQTPTIDAGNITFNNTIDGGWDLAVTAVGAATFSDLIGNGTPLTSLTVSGSSIALPATVNTTANQHYESPVTLAGSGALLSTGGSITFDTAVTGAGSLDVTATTGGISLTSVTTNGNQSYSGAVTLPGAGTFNAGGTTNTVTFNNSVSGSGSLTVNNSTTVLGGNVTTSGPQIYGDVQIMSGLTLTASGGLSFGHVDSFDVPENLTINDGTFGDAVAIGVVGSGIELSSLHVTATNITLSSVHTTGVQDYAGAVTVTTNPTFLSDSGTITFEQQIFGTGSGITVTAANGIVLESTVTTSGAQVYQGPVTLAADTTVNSTGGSIQFASTIDGTTTNGQSLTVEAATSAEFDGNVGFTTPLNTFLVSAGSIVSGGVSNVHALNQSYNIGSGLTLSGNLTFSGGFSDQGQINLGADTTITAANGDINISGAVDGAHALSLVGSAGSVILTGPIGANVALLSLDVTGANGIQLGSTVNTTGGQGYHSPVTLIADPTLTAGTVRFDSTVTDTGGNPLVISAAGGITFAGNVSTVSSQTYNDPVSIAGNLTIQSTGGSLTFNSTIDGTTAGAQSLVLGAVGSIQLDGAIGGTTAFSSFATSGNTVLAGPTAITTTGGGITFGGQLNNLTARQGSLTLNAGGGNVNFDDLVGNSAALGNVTISNANNVTGPALNLSSLAAGSNEFKARSLTVGSGTAIAGAFTMLGGISIVPGDNQTGATTTGAVFIDATGAVTIGTVNSNSNVSDLGVFARGADITSSGIAGNGGTVTITGASLTLAGVSVRGGEAQSGVAGGGNAGTITLTSTGGGITILGAATDTGLSASGGYSTNGATGGHGGTITVNTAGAFSGGNISADGGASASGNGGDAGSITVTAPTIASSRFRARGGDTASATGAGGAGGAVTLIATGTGGNVITLTGNASDFSGNANAITYGTLNVRGGEAGVTDATTTDNVRGTIAGAGGAITIEGNSSGGALQGAVLLTNGGTGAGPTPGNSFQGGPDILISAGGTTGHGGTVTIQGSIETADNKVESLQLGGPNATTTIAGDIGSASKLLGTLVLAGNGSTISVGGSVTTNAIVEQRTTGSFTVAGTISTNSYISPIVNTVSLDLSKLFSGSGNVSLAGSYLLVNGGDFSADSLTLAGTTVISTPTGASPLLLGSIDGAFGLTLNGGTGALGFNSIGTHTALASLTISAGTINLGSVVTTGAQSYTGTITTGGTYVANGFTSSGPIVMAANTTINGGVGDINLGAVSGAFGLSLISSDANVFFNGNVGSTTARVPSLSITGADNVTVQNNSSLQVGIFNGAAINGTIDFGNHSLESDDIVAIQANAVEGRIITTSDATINAGSVSGTIQGSAVSVTASGAVNADVTADSANVSGGSFSGSVQATRSANIAATGDISGSVSVTSGGASLSAANVSGSVTSAGLAQIAATQTVAENLTSGGLDISGTAAITGNYTSTGAPISIVGASLNGNVTGLNGGSVVITASQFIVGNIAGGDVALTAPFIEVNITATTASINSDFAILTGTIGGVDATSARFPIGIQQGIFGVGRQVADSGDYGDNGGDNSSSDDDNDKKKAARAKESDTVYDFANQYIDNLISGKPGH